jgi:negative regulator of sigma E activity
VVVQRVSLWRWLRVLRDGEWDSLLSRGVVASVSAAVNLLVQSSLFSSEGAFAGTKEAAATKTIPLSAVTFNRDG